eukprot:8995456-Pyramimonas_sp.AAC.1
MLPLFLPSTTTVLIVAQLWPDGPADLCGRSAGKAACPQPQTEDSPALLEPLRAPGKWGGIGGRTG